MISSHSFHLAMHDSIEVKYNEEGKFHYIKIRSDINNDIYLNFKDREHLQVIITSLQKQLDEIQERA